MENPFVFLVYVALLLVAVLVAACISKRIFNRKAAAQQLRENSYAVPVELLQLALSSVQAVVWDYRPQTEEIHLGRSESWHDIFGDGSQNTVISLEELKSYVHPDDWPGTIRSMRDYIATGGAEYIEAEFRLRKKDGGWHWILSKGKAVEWDDKGMPTRIVGIDLNVQRLMQAHEKVHQSEEKFRAIFENAPYPISIRNFDDGKYLEANRAFMNALGIDVKALPQLTPDDIYNINAQEFAEIHWELSAKGFITNREVKAIKKDGAHTHLIFSAIILDIQGQKRVLSMAMDETERKRTEEALKESETRFRTLFKMAPLPMAHISKDGKILDINDLLMRTMGHSANKVPTLARAWELAMPDPDLRRRVTSKWLKGVERAMEEGSEIAAIECPLHYMDGTVHSVVVTTRLVADSIIVGFYDITKRKQAEDAIDLERRQLLSIFDGINELVYVADPHTYEILFANRRLQDQFGKNPTGGICYRELQGTDQPCDFCTNPIILNNNGQPHSWEYHNPHVNIDVAIVDQIIKWPDGRDVRLEIAVDVTDQKKAEAARERLQAQLLQSQKMEAVGILAGGVAHDFNNMLGAIIGYTELIMSNMAPSDEHHENLGKILDAAKRSAGLTRQLLAFARKQTIAPVVFDINQAIEAILNMVRRLIGENIELFLHPSSVPCMVRMDPSQFDQILLNLCVNAKDAISDVGRITIETEAVFLDESYNGAHDRVEPGTYVLISISDNGSGMDRKTLDHIFEPFFTTKDVGQGTGMGLATVYGIVKQNEGAINVYSEPGKGTTFRIHLPLSADDTQEEKATVDTETPQSRGETILLVEDDPMLLEMGTAMLQRLGYKVLPASKPVEAIRVAREIDDEIHLFITDVVMPEMNGRDLADRLLSIRPGIKHIFMSGYTASIIAPQGVLDDASNFLQKPFSGRALAVKVREVLDV